MNKRLENAKLCGAVLAIALVLLYLGLVEQEHHFVNPMDVVFR
jgi:hypothetical protein